MILPPPHSTRTDTRFPDTTLFRSAGSMMETAAHALGCTVFPGGVGQTEQQVQAIADLAPSGYTGTPSFLKIILEKADQMGVPLPSLKRALFSGEAFPPSLCKWFSERGIDGYQAYGSADLGMRSEEHTSELQSLMRISYAVFCLTNKKSQR